MLLPGSRNNDRGAGQDSGECLRLQGWRRRISAARSLTCVACLLPFLSARNAGVCQFSARETSFALTTAGDGRVRLFDTGASSGRTEAPPPCLWHPTRHAAAAGGGNE